MEGLILLFLAIIIGLIILLKNSMSERISLLEEEIIKLRESLKVKPVLVPEKKSVFKPEPIPEVKPIVPEAPKATDWESGFKILPGEPIFVEETTEKETASLHKEESYLSGEILPNPQVFNSAKILTPPPIKATEPKIGFFERNPDLEKFIGENIVSKIGIGILVLAIAFFVKYAIDNDWIGEIGRVAIGIICGGILVGIAHKLRDSYTAFSSVLLGGGLAIFYFTITLAYHQFHLFSQTMAFIIMVVITGFAVAISMLYDKQELAVIALVGGYLTPFMVSDGSGNYKTLFIYLIVLNTGLLIMAYHKAWRVLNILAFIFTVFLFGGWLFSIYGVKPIIAYKHGFIFATIFYVLFFIINIANNIKENKKFIGSDFGILLLNTSLYFGAGLFCLYQMQADAYKGLFSAVLAVINLGVSFLLFKNKKTDVNIVYLLIGLTLTFISLTAPLQLKGNYITLFWASEAVLLYWLFTVSRISLFRLSSFLIYAAMILSLFIDWDNIYFSSEILYPVIFNKGFITTLYAAIASMVFYIFIDKEEKKTQVIKGEQYNRLVLIISIGLLYVSGALEVYFQFERRLPGNLLNIQYLLLYTYLFATVFIVFAKKIIHDSYVQNIKLALCLAGIFLFFVFTPTMYYHQNNILQTGNSGLPFILPLLVSAAALVFLFMQIVTIMKKNYNAATGSISIFLWILVLAIIAFISIDVNMLTRQIFFSKTLPPAEIDRVFIKTGLPILWGLCSFILMWMGMKLKFRTLRVISLTLFSVTLFKLFVFDIQNIPVAGKIAAFFFLGVLLLVVSFMYQRLKKIITQDEKPVV